MSIFLTFSASLSTTSNVLSGTDNVEIFDTSVQRSTTQERNLESLRIEEESLKSIFPELRSKFDSSVRVNLANSALSKSPNLKRLRHPPIETADIWNLECISATRPKNYNGLQRSVDRYYLLGIRMVLKLWVKRQLTGIILRIRKLKLEKFLSGKLRALKIFNGHYQ